MEYNFSTGEETEHYMLNTSEMVMQLGSGDEYVKDLQFFLMEDQSQMPTDFNQWAKKVPVIIQNEYARNSGVINSFVTSIDKEHSFG